jgi:hypothetical protein
VKVIRMARERATEPAHGAKYRSLTPPGVFLLRMLIFLALIGFLAAILNEQLRVAFMTNPGLNGLIVGTMIFGILYTFRQVMRLYPEIRWVNAFRISDPGLAITYQPKLLAPMATMLRDRTGVFSLSTTSMRSIMDSISSRLDEARDTGRYLVGLLVFLGLLGTFWGLLDTIQSVGGAIDSLNPKAGDGGVMFEELKTNLAKPLKGMGTAFSSSLLGLTGSLILGFLELQASQAHNRFYNELEEWLSGITELTPGASVSGDQNARELSRAVTDMKVAVANLAHQMQLAGARTDQAADPSGADESVRELANGVNQLVTQMRNEQKIVREWVDDQVHQQASVASVLKDVAEHLHRKGS